MPPVFSNTGKAVTTSRMQTGTDYIGWGTGAGVAAAADTTLFTEGPEARVAATKTQQTTTTTSDAVQWIATLTAAAARAVTNAGVFDASTVGNIVVKGDFATVNLASGDSIQFTIKLTYA